MAAPVLLDLDPESPHTPQRTAELTGALVEIVRLLGEATRDGAEPAPGLGWPVSPEDLLDRLSRLADGTARLYPQLAEGLRRHHDDGAWRASPVPGFARDLDADLAVAADHLRQATALSGQVAQHLVHARNLLGAVHPNYPGAEHARGEADRTRPGAAPVHPGLAGQLSLMLAEGLAPTGDLVPAAAAAAAEPEA